MTGVLVMLVSVLLLWVVGGLVGFCLAVVTGGVAVMFGLRSRRSAGYARNRAWWLGMTAVVLTVASFVAVLTLNVLVPDKAKGGVSCVLTNSCPRGDRRLVQPEQRAQRGDGPRRVGRLEAEALQPRVARALHVDLEVVDEQHPMPGRRRAGRPRR